MLTEGTERTGERNIYWRNSVLESGMLTGGIGRTEERNVD